MKLKVVTVFGGTGFLGRHVVRELTKKGWAVRVVCRNPNFDSGLKVNGVIGQVSVETGNICSAYDIARYTENSDAVINLVGVGFERGRQNFSGIHAQAAENLAKACYHNKVDKLIHISSLGVDKSSRSKYSRTKLAGERAVSAAFPHAVIIRPGILFGHDDNFFNMFARIALISPFLPLFGGGKSKFQPVYAGDVAKAIAEIIDRPVNAGKTYELGGSEIMTFKEIMLYILRLIKRKRVLLSIPSGLAKFIAIFTGMWPKPILTQDQIILLGYDNLVSVNAHKFAELGIEPTSMDAVIPEYLKQYQPS